MRGSVNHTVYRRHFTQALSIGIENDNGLMPEEVSLPSQNPWLMGYHLAKGKEEIVLTSTAADALVASQHLSIPALCTPAGK